MTRLYRVAFRLADRLIERHGLLRVAAYFRAFATRSDADENFRWAFGQRLDAFARAMTLENSHLDLTPASSEAVIVRLGQQIRTGGERCSGQAE